jgi:HK97 gp10 family phage protein
MANGVTVKFRGLRELDAGLAALAEEVSGRAAKAALTRAVKEAAKPMAARMAELAPHGVTGKLARSIVIDTSGKKRLGNAAFAAAKRSGGDDASAVLAARNAQRGGAAVIVLVGPSKSVSGLAAIVEYGSRPHRIRPRSKGGKAFVEVWQGGQVVAYAREVEHPGTHPHPFLRPAFEQTAPEFFEHLKPALRAQIERGLARARAKALK